MRNTIIYSINSIYTSFSLINSVMSVVFYMRFLHFCKETNTNLLIGFPTLLESATRTVREETYPRNCPCIRVVAYDGPP